MKRFLLVDCDNLMHRAFHAMPPLPVDGRQTGALHGFLKSILQLRELYETTNVAFCFDKGPVLRKEICPTYKLRETATAPAYKKDKDKRHLKRQMVELQDFILPDLGMANVLAQDGYEADDLIAGLCNGYAVKRGVIASSDKDLFQCLRGGISMHDVNAKEEVTEESFKKKYQVTPQEWITVKAIAGCASDCIGGIEGVGEKTAIRFIRGDLGPKYKQRLAIEAGGELIEFNRRLVELPFPGLKLPDLYEDADTPESWRKVLHSLKMERIASWVHNS